MKLCYGWRNKVIVFFIINEKKKILRNNFIVYCYEVVQIYIHCCIYILEGTTELKAVQKWN